MKTRIARNRVSPALLGVLLSVFSCVSGPGSLQPIAAPDAEPGCPGGRASWKLDVLDRRAERRTSEKVTALVAESVRRSFPECRFEGIAAEAPTITIEVHSFGATFSDREGMWDAATVWTVSAREASGRSLTEFECAASTSIVNYRSSNNGKDLLGRVFEKALRRAVSGLRAIPAF